MKKTELIIALDLPSGKEAVELAGRLINQADFFKVGLQLFLAEGPAIVARLKALGARVFLDLKLHDISNTVRNAVIEAVKMNVDMLTVHTLGGRDMLEAAALAARETAHQGIDPPKILGVTILTSHNNESLAEIGLADPIEDQVLRLATLAEGAGLSGVVSSGRETAMLRNKLGDDFLLIVPGIRPAQGEHGDQKRAVTPEMAIKAGADYLVVGRPIIESADPALAFKLIKTEAENVNRL